MWVVELFHPLHKAAKRTRFGPNGLWHVTHGIARDVLARRPALDGDWTAGAASEAQPETGSNASLSREADGQVIEQGLCTFWLHNRCFAVDISLVREVVNVDSVVAVPLSPPALLGLFNLRGMWRRQP